jgi:hypothetical protein
MPDEEAKNPRACTTQEAIPIDNLIMKDFPCLVVDLLLSTTYL